MPRETKIGTEIAHITRDSDTIFRVKRSKGQGHQAGFLTAAYTHRQLQRSAWERIERGKLLLIRCRLQARGRLGGARRYGAHMGGEGRGHFVSPRAQLVSVILFSSTCGCVDTQVMFYIAGSLAQY